MKYIDISEIVQRLDSLFIENISTDFEKGKICIQCKKMLPFSSFNERITNNLYNKKTKYFRPTCADCEELNYADKGLKMMLKNFLRDSLDDDSKYQKIKKLIKLTECEGCKYSKEIQGKYYPEYIPIDAENNAACSFCDIRADKLYDIKYKMQKQAEKQAILTVDNRSDILKLKIILTKLTKKIKNYDAS